VYYPLGSTFVFRVVDVCVFDAGDDRAYCRCDVVCSPYCSVSSLVVILGDIIDGKDRRRSGEAEGGVGLRSGRTV